MGTLPAMLTLACSFAPQTKELATVRAILRPYAESVGAVGKACEDVVIVATELAANAIEAGRGSEVRLRASADRQSIVIELDNDGPDFELPSADDLPSPGQQRGRGLWLVRALTTDLSVERRQDRTVVRAVLGEVRPGNGAAAAVRSS